MIQTEKRPIDKRWKRISTPPSTLWDSNVLACSAWRLARGTTVISSLLNAELPDGSGIGLQWHISISNRGERPKTVGTVLRAFGMSDAEEDNHHPGAARHFFLPLDPAHRVDCECKETEDTIVEPDGYRWTNPKPGTGPCRGCELEAAIGKPCPIHHA